MHPGEERSDVEFGIKVLRYTRSSFERQILESVMIQGKRDQHILNSRSEFNRCAIPRLVTKLGEKELKKWREDDIEMQKNEERVEERIRMMKKESNRMRAGGQRRDPKAKRMKLEEGAEENNSMRERNILTTEQEKRKMGEQNTEERCTKKRRKEDIRSYLLERIQLNARARACAK